MGRVKRLGMRKSGPKIIQITGIRGIFLAIFVVTCLIAGFVVFPGKVAESLWNYVGSTYITLPEIALWQGILLWAMTALSLYLLNDRKFAISFQQPTELSEEEMSFLMERIKMQRQAQKLNAMILKSNDIKVIKKDIDSKLKDDKEQQQESVNNINEKHL